MNKKIYLNEKVPTSNSIPNVYYALTIKTENREYTRHLYTVNDLQTFVANVRRNKDHRITRAYRVNTETGEYVSFIPETRQEKTDRENHEHCKYIADEVESYAAGNMYRCPECGETIQWQNEQYNIDDATYTCPCCNSEFDESDLEALSLYDYFEDVLDIEYRVGSNKELKSVSLMATCGGPNIYIDTAKKAVLLYWGTSRAEYPLSYDTCSEIDAWAEELWNC